MLTDLRNRIARKIANDQGESIGETLVGLLIAGLAFTFLCSAVVIAARINAGLSNQDTAFTLGSAAATGTVSVTMTVEGDASRSYQATYQDRPAYESADQEYVYYE